MKIEKHLISDIHESEYNPRISLDSSSRQYKAIKKSIDDYGFVEPIVVNDVTMSCIGGHQRLSVMRDMGEKEIDCVMLHIENPEKEKALCIALNKIKGDWDNEKLQELLRDDEIREFELGFDKIEVTLDDEINSIVEDLGDYSDEEDEDDSSYDDTDADSDASLSDEETPKAGTVIKVGSYHFEMSAPEYEEMIAAIRDRGFFERSEIIDELRRKLCSD